MVVDNKIPSETLLTQKALELSLSPPRCPPYYTAHRLLLQGKDPSGNPYITHHDDQAHSDYNRHTGMRERLLHLLDQSYREIPRQHFRRRRLPHPHVATGPEVSDQITRFLGTILPLPWQNYCRDSGAFRTISDTLVTWSIPIGAISNPSAAVEFLRLSERLIQIPYGNHHEMQFIDMYFPPDCPEAHVTGLVFFVHGGAWGSGKPWFYRLIATPFLRLKLAVAIVGYRTYPTGTIDVQVLDVQLAAIELSKRYPDLCGPTRRGEGTWVRLASFRRGEGQSFNMPTSFVSCG